jgi:hypothetical protein
MGRAGIVFLIAFVLVGSASAATYRPGFSRATEAAAYCLTASEWVAFAADPWDGGYYLPETQQVFLNPWDCRVLDHRKRARPYELIPAVFTLAHERQHVLGVLDEDEADCQAGRTLPLIAHRLGIRFRTRDLRAFFSNPPTAAECRPPIS